MLRSVLAMEQIGKYQVVEKIGEGGFGIIFKGFDPHIKRTVAIKTCTSDDSEIRQRFSQEAHIAGNLHHRNITTVFDFGTHEEVPYLIQEYLTGEDLDRKIKRKEGLLFAEKLLYLIQISRGMEFAHRQGVIHRDIKPSNIRILDDGTTKIMDFGIAKLANQETSLTQTGMTLGTAAYLAPEQIRGEKIDSRTDIFSFGVLTYELLTYQRPFSGKHISTVLYQILNEEPVSPREINPDIPPLMQQVVNRCLNKDPNKRFQSFSEVLVSLNGLLRSRNQENTISGEIEATTKRVRKLETTPIAVPQSEGRPKQTASSSAPVGDMEFSLVDDRTPHSISSTQAMRHRGFSFGPWIIAILSLVILGGGLFWWNSRNDEKPPQLAATESNDSSSTENADNSSSDPTATEGSPESTEEDPTEDDGAESEDGTSDGGDTTENETPAELEEDQAPVPGTLVIPAPRWSARVSITIGGRKYPLRTQGWSNEVEAGSYTIEFVLNEDDYYDFTSQTVTVAAGERKVVRVPLRQPATLSIQPKLGSAGGILTLGDKALEARTINKMTRPGRKVLNINRAGEDQPAIVYEFNLNPGQKKIITYDLNAGRVISDI